ncbi:hypothetical protein OS493_019374 [Desmophyllum pertusum]|uniref:Uncharacterized protein n=1 Tax=Desmophyllum pertusum TaxID=174260 RepID=A0A9X0DA57_9CNID|nr:hypothetical protein OS493_019374 [Desmophyllum pertusum]
MEVPKAADKKNKPLKAANDEKERDVQLQKPGAMSGKQILRRQSSHTPCPNLLQWKQINHSLLPGHFYQRQFSLHHKNCTSFTCRQKCQASGASETKHLGPMLPHHQVQPQ